MLNPEFLLTSMVVVLLPGAGVLYTLAVGLGRGFVPSIAAAFGCTLGIVPSALAGIAGLAAILHTSAVAFQIIKYLGVLYLLYMAWNITRSGGALDIEENRAPATLWRIAVNGTLINVLNPKLSLFFLAFLPQFVEAASPSPTFDMVLLAAVFMAMTGRVTLTRLLLLVVAGIFIWSTYKGIYHIGVEYRWWPGPPTCSGTIAPVTLGGGGGGILGQLEEGHRVVSCTDATWRFPADWGLSFAGWNAVISLVVAAMALVGALRPARPHGSSSVSQ